MKSMKNHSCGAQDGPYAMRVATERNPATSTQSICIRCSLLSSYKYWIDNNNDM